LADGRRVNPLFVVIAVASIGCVWPLAFLVERKARLEVYLAAGIMTLLLGVLLVAHLLGKDKLHRQSRR